MRKSRFTCRLQLVAALALDKQMLEEVLARRL